MGIVASKPTTKAEFLTALNLFVDGLAAGSIRGSDNQKMYEALYDQLIFKGDIAANQIPFKNSSNATSFATIAEQQITGRLAGGQIKGLTASEVRGIIGVQQTTKISIANAAVLTLNATPVTLVAAPGANLIAIPKRIIIRHNFVSAAFATNTTLQVRIGTVEKDLTTAVLAAGATQIDLEDIDGLYANILANTAIQLLVKTGNPTAGGGSLDVWLTYETISVA